MTDQQTRPDETTPEALSERDFAILALEHDHPTWTPGRKTDWAYTELGLLPTRHHQILQALLDQPAALREFPTTVRRLQRLRDRRRTASRAGFAAILIDDSEGHW